MRLRVIASSCLLIAVSAGGVSTLAASPDCARWIKDYQQGLAKRAVLAKKHVVHAARHIGVPRRKLVHLAQSPHRLRPAKLSPQEMLKRFRVLCGEDLPEETLPVSFVPTSLDAMMVPPVIPPDAAPLTDITGPVPFVPAVVPGADTGTVVPTQPSQPIPSGGIPGTSIGTPVIPTPNVPVDTPAPSPVPEPGSLLLLLTGAAGAVPVVLRRRRNPVI